MKNENGVETRPHLAAVRRDVARGHRVGVRDERGAARLGRVAAGRTDAPETRRLVGGRRRQTAIAAERDAVHVSRVRVERVEERGRRHRGEGREVKVARAAALSAPVFVKVPRTHYLCRKTKCSILFYPVSTKQCSLVSLIFWAAFFLEVRITCHVYWLYNRLKVNDKLLFLAKRIYYFCLVI